MNYTKAVEKYETEHDILGPLPCKWCHKPTQRSTLNNYGARCFTCYEAYLLEPQQTPDCGDKRSEGDRAWAYALKRRDEAGESLSRDQRAMWRAVVRQA